MTATEQAALEEWCELLNRGDYFRAHEVLEQAWLAAREPEKTFLKGLIHVAVALYHYRRGNAHGARVKFRSARGYLSGYAPEYADVQVAALLQDLDRFFRPLLQTPAGAPPPEPEGPWPRVVRLPGGDEGDSVPDGKFKKVKRPQKN